MTTTTDRPQPRTAAALAARRRDTQAALDRVHEAITRLRRDKTPATVAAVARRADVSRTFLYTNSDAKTAVAKAIRETAAQRDRLQDKQEDAGAASWRERALNAEHALKTANHEIIVQRTRIGELLGRQLTADNRTLDERLNAARSNLRFQDRRIADLEARLADHPSAAR